MPAHAAPITSCSEHGTRRWYSNGVITRRAVKKTNSGKASRGWGKENSVGAMSTAALHNSAVMVNTRCSVSPIQGSQPARKWYRCPRLRPEVPNKARACPRRICIPPRAQRSRWR